MMETMSAIGERLRKAREERNESARKVAEDLGYTHSYLSQIERGVKDPNVWDLLIKLARRYGTSTDYLLGLTNNPAPVDNSQNREESAELAAQHHTITDTQRAILELLDQLPEDEQEFVIELIQFVIQRSTPRIIG